MHAPQPREGGSGTSESDASLASLLKAVVKSLSQSIDRQLAAYDLTEAQALPLLTLANQGCRTQGELANRLECDSGAMVRILDRLEAKGMLTRARSSSDRRIVDLCMTEKGRHAVAHIPDVTDQVIAAHMTGLSGQEQRTLLELLQRIRVNKERNGAAVVEPVAAWRPAEDALAELPARPPR